MTNFSNREEKLPHLARFLTWFSSTFLIIVVSVLVVVVFVILYLFISCQYAHFKYNDFRKTKPFDAAIWKEINPQKEKASNRKYLRCNMYKDLVRNYLHFDMSYEEVVKLLGVPESIDYYDNPKSKTIDYEIGECAFICLSEATDAQGYVLYLDFNSGSKIVAFGHNDDWHQKKGISLKNRKDLFYCNDKGICRRYIKQTNSTIRKEEECKKSEVEAKWGYKVW